MKTEVFVAADWWASKIVQHDLTQEQLTKFKTELRHQLFLKYEGHWYKDDPLRGNAYRSITFDKQRNQIDDVLLAAAKAATINNLSQRLGPCGVIMWVDPGEVAVQYFSKQGTLATLYKEQPNNNNNGTLIAPASNLTSSPTAATPGKYTSWVVKNSSNNNNVNMYQVCAQQEERTTPNQMSNSNKDNMLMAF
jgi:hypothetical protein